MEATENPEDKEAIEIELASLLDSLSPKQRAFVDMMLDDEREDYPTLNNNQP